MHPHKQLSPIIYVSYSLVIVSLGIYNGRKNYRANYRFAEKYVQNLFDAVESNAVLVPSGDVPTITTAYYHLVEGKRSDIRLLQHKGIFLNDRILPALASKQKIFATWLEFAKNTERPFYYQNILDVFL